ncbi:MAG TPA: hypothetical protein DD416_05145 [Rhodobacteraceae bacterium]|jgi:hypothetical protein|nr:hypothetical protein [Paracoccaceae bacterium]
MQPVGSFKLRGAANAVLSRPAGVTGVTLVQPAITAEGLPLRRRTLASARATRSRLTSSRHWPTATRGGIFPDHHPTLSLCRAMQTLFCQDRLVAEESTFVGLTGLQTGHFENLKGPVGLGISGRNVDARMFVDILNGRDVDLGAPHIKGSPYPD